MHTFTILLAGIALNSLLLGAFAPISLFFLVSGSQYEFLILLHVAIFTFCGVASLLSIKRNMDIVSTATMSPESKSPESESPESKSPESESPESKKSTDTLSPTSSTLLRIWFVVYMFIGAQMSYLLSPFIGREQLFSLFPTDKENFFSYLFNTIRSLLDLGAY